MENKLRHIDDLLKTSLEQLADYPALDSDWLAVESRLKQRRNRIYAMWFSLALITLIGGTMIFTSVKQSPTIADTQDTIEHTSPQDDAKQSPVDEDNTNVQITQNDKTDSQIPSEPLDLPNEAGQTPDNNSMSSSSSSDDASGSHTDPTASGDQQGIGSRPTGDDIPLMTGPSIPSTPWMDYSTLNTIEWDMVQWVYDEESKAESFDYNMDFLKDGQKPAKAALGFGVSHTEIGISFTPSYAGKFVSENITRSGLIHQSYYDKVLGSEHAAPAYNIGFNYEVHFVNHLFVGFGIGATERTEFVKYNYEIDQIPVVDGNANRITNYIPSGVNSELVNYQGSNSYHFIEIPLTVGYDLPIGKKLSWRTQADFSYMLLTNRLGVKADYTYLQLYDLKDQQYFNQSTFATTFKSGIYFNFKKFVIGAEPVFSTNLNSLTDNSAALKIKPYSYGLNITTNIKF